MDHTDRVNKVIFELEYTVLQFLEKHNTWVAMILLLKDEEKGRKEIAKNEWKQNKTIKQLKIIMILKYLYALS